MGEGLPDFAYRETITTRVEQVYAHKRHIGGGGEYAEVKILFEPLPTQEGFEFVEAIPPGTIPEAFIPAVWQGIEAERQLGPCAGYPVIGFRAVLLDAKCHDIDSSERTFALAARGCFRTAVERAGPVVLEAIMRAEIAIGEDHLRGLMGALSARSGTIADLADCGRDIVIEALVAVSRLGGFDRELRGIAGRQPALSLALDHYEPAHGQGFDPTFPGAAAARVA
jgi:elongation factor G